jgi:hypothetical protein
VYLQMLKKAGFNEIKIYEESAPYEKGNAQVSSITFSGYKSLSKRLTEPNHCWNT